MIGGGTQVVDGSGGAGSRRSETEEEKLLKSVSRSRAGLWVKPKRKKEG